MLLGTFRLFNQVRIRVYNLGLDLPKSPSCFLEIPSAAAAGVVDVFEEN
jgi:hypothetical protein